MLDPVLAIAHHILVFSLFGVLIAPLPAFAAAMARGYGELPCH